MCICTMLQSVCAIVMPSVRASPLIISASSATHLCAFLAVGTREGEVQDFKPGA